MKASTKAIRRLETSHIAEGPKSGDPIKLAQFQKQFVTQRFAMGVQTVQMSIWQGRVLDKWTVWTGCQGASWSGVRR